MIRRFALTVAVAGTVVALAQSLTASEPVTTSPKVSGIRQAGVPMVERSGYIVASS